MRFDERYVGGLQRDLALANEAAKAALAELDKVQETLIREAQLTNEWMERALGAEKVLREMEWDGYGGGCPACYRSPQQGHTAECNLHEALERGKG